MHNFTELVDHCACFTLGALDEAHGQVIEALNQSAATPLIKALQMIQLQKAITAVGMLSIYDALLQDQLNCSDGFRGAKEALVEAGEAALQDRFAEFQLAINVLKHGRGRSYDALIEKIGTLPFRVKLPNEGFFFEGDVGEVSTLVEVDNDFVTNCARVIREVSEALKKSGRFC
jgi:hypothetical protein